MKSGVVLLFDFFIVGGDKRLVYMAKFLLDKNYKVLTYGLEFNTTNIKIKKTDSLKYGIKNSKNIICPIPFTKDYIFLQCSSKKIYIRQLLMHISSYNNLFGGLIPSNVLEFAKNNNIFVYDYMKNEKFLVYNSIYTAEVAVAQAILQNPVSMHFSRCLVLGFGNCGKLICNKLKNLCLDVFVCTDDKFQRAWANAYGYSSFGLDSLMLNVKNFNYIFNTIPKRIFYGKILRNFSRDAFILDITKEGADWQQCKENNIRIKYIPNIPGRYKAISTAKTLTETTLKVLSKIKEQEVS